MPENIPNLSPDFTPEDHVRFLRKVGEIIITSVQIYCHEPSPSVHAVLVGTGYLAAVKPNPDGDQDHLVCASPLTSRFSWSGFLRALNKMGYYHPQMSLIIADQAQWNKIKGYPRVEVNPQGQTTYNYPYSAPDPNFTFYEIPLCNSKPG